MQTDFKKTNIFSKLYLKWLFFDLILSLIHDILRLFRIADISLITNILNFGSIIIASLLIIKIINEGINEARIAPDNIISLCILSAAIIVTLSNLQILFLPFITKYVLILILVCKTTIQLINEQSSMQLKCLIFLVMLLSFVSLSINFGIINLPFFWQILCSISYYCQKFTCKTLKIHNLNIQKNSIQADSLTTDAKEVEILAQRIKSHAKNCTL